MHGTRTILAEEGIRGIYSGLFPVVRSSVSIPSLSPDFFLPDAPPISQLSSPLHGLHRPKATRPIQRATRAEDTYKSHVRNGCVSRVSHRVLHDALGVRHLPPSHPGRF
jgi:hypothetical protein